MYFCLFGDVPAVVEDRKGAANTGIPLDVAIWPRVNSDFPRNISITSANTSLSFISLIIDSLSKFPTTTQGI